MALDVTYNGVTASSLGAIVTSISPPVRAQRRIQAVEVPGRDGVVHIDDGTYGPITKVVGLGLVGMTKMDAVQAWLASSGTLVCSNEPGRAYKVTQVEAVEWERIGRTLYQTLVQFDAEPFRYLNPAAANIVLTAPGQIVNQGTVFAEPVITVEGTGEIDLAVGDVTLGIAGLASSITIDVPQRLAYHDGINLTGSLTGDEWPTLPMGSTAVSWTGSVTRIIITPNWRTL
jgi:phage-related protein